MQITSLSRDQEAIYLLGSG